ncbi:MAG: hypothetical protein IBX39_07415 [Candidatus Methanoperedenaceae archaeon]|nr:hypothetical protein [Candidatus Methanoperedenaceae archaeon]MDW7727732.1 hypothetical protein [Candidatus Methanoperedens sp.]
MEQKDIGLAIVMIMSSLVLTYRWLERLGGSDIIIVISAMILIGSLATMILFVDMRIRELETVIESKERSLRINILGVEENLEKRIDNFTQKTNEKLGDFSKKFYR